MTFRSSIVATGLGTVAAPAMARTVHVMGMTIQQPEAGPQREVFTTGSVGARYVVQDGRSVVDRAEHR